VAGPLGGHAGHLAAGLDRVSWQCGRVGVRGGVAAARLSGIMAPAALHCLALLCPAPPCNGGGSPTCCSWPRPRVRLAAGPLLLFLLPLPCSRFMTTRVEKDFETEEFLEGAKDAFHTGGGKAAAEVGLGGGGS
jgi:hypothetical protein